MNRNWFSLLGILAIVLAISCGIFIELFFQQEPCALCFLQRASMGLVALGLYWGLVYGVTVRYYAFSLGAAILGLSISLKHMTLNVCKPVESSTFFFLFHRIYTWSFLVFFSSLIALAFLLFFYKASPPLSRKVQNVMGGVLLFMFTLCLISVVHHKGLAF